MSRLNALFTAIIVLDANILLGLYRLAPEKSGKLLDILEALSHRIWIPRQFWEEYRRRRPEMPANIGKEYRQTQASLQSNRDKSKKSLLRLTERYSFESEQYILAFDALYDEVIGTVHSSAKEYINRAEFDEVDERIASLCAGRVGDPLPDSTIADIPSIWQWRLDQGIPPGLKDRKKPVPNRYGDLTGWLQITRHAIGRDRPVIMVTDDIKANDWFVIKNGNPSGPHPDLTRELHDEAGVGLYLYTSEQFMWLAERFLKWQRHVAASAEYFRLDTPALLPDFTKLSTFESIYATTARMGLLNGYTDSFSSLAGFTAGESYRSILDSFSEISALSDTYVNSLGALAGFTAGESYKNILDSFSGISAFSDAYANSLGAMAGITAGDSYKGILDSISGMSAFGDLYANSLGALAGITAGESYKGLLDSISGISAFGDANSLGTLTGFSVSESYRGLVDSVSRIGALGDSYKHTLGSLTGFAAGDSHKRLLDAVSGIGVLDGSVGSMAGLGTLDYSMKHLHDSMAGIGLLSERISTISGIGSLHNSLSTQSLISDVLRTYDFGRPRALAMLQESILDLEHRAIQPYLEQQRLVDAMMEPYLEYQRQMDSMIEPYHEWHKLIGSMMESFREQQRQVDSMMELVLEQQKLIDSMMKPFLEEQRRIAANFGKSSYS